MRSLRRVTVAAVAAVAAAWLAACTRSLRTHRAGDAPPARTLLTLPAVLPDRAARERATSSDTAFADLIERLSETPGYFDSDNIITNEGSYLDVAPQLAKLGVRGGAYLGVGPDQNFSYVAMVRPSIAFMIDIRRDNLLEHLLFKAVFELSQDRMDYLCLLLGKPVPRDAPAWRRKPVADILAYLARTPSDSQLVGRTGRLISERIARFGVPLDARDASMIDRYRAEFVADGLETRYSSLGRNNRFDYPSFGQLIAETDRTGRQASYLASDDAFQLVRSMEVSNRIIPVTGNVAGDRAMAAIARYIATHGFKVSAFYLSNVEQYLLTRDGGFAAYERNVDALPRDAQSVIIRSYFGRFGRSHPLAVPGHNSTSMIETIDSFVRRYRAGQIATYADLVFSGFVPP